MVAPAAVLTLEHIRRDLARKPPPPPASASTFESHASLRGLALCLLLQQQVQLQVMTSNDDDSSSKQQQVARDLMSTEAALRQAAADVVEEAEEETHADAPHDFEMAEAWGEEGEDEEEDTAREAASTKEWYLKLLTTYNVLPVRLPLPTSESNTSSSSDESEHQSMRDIERDSLKVNGAAYQPGGLGGHTRVLVWLEDVLHSHLQASGCSLLPPKAKLDAFVRRILRQVNRTNSAGAAYDVLSKRLGVEGVTAIVPDSKAAEPLEIEVDTGLFPLPTAAAATGTAAAAGGGFGWGLRARLRTATSYVIYDEGVEEEWMSVRAEYRETVCLPLVLVGGEGGGGRDGGKGRGVVRQQPLSLGACVRLSERKKGA